MKPINIKVGKHELSLILGNRYSILTGVLSGWVSVLLILLILEITRFDFYSIYGLLFSIIFYWAFYWVLSDKLEPVIQEIFNKNETKKNL